MRVLATRNGELFAGGLFHIDNGNGASWIARWNEATGEWLSVGTGVNDSVSALLVYQGDLIAGGWLSNAGGQTVNGIARWDGSAWHSIGGGMNSPVLALGHYKGDLIASGLFTFAGGAPADHVARWNGTSWQSMGDGYQTKSHLRALTVFKGQLYAAASAKFFQWSGSDWVNLGFFIQGNNPGIFAMVEYNGELIAAGRFGRIDGAFFNNIARWNGSQWQRLGAGISDVIEALAIYNGELIAGGYFQTANGQSANNIARWNGSYWQPMGSGMAFPGGAPPVHAVTVHGDELIAAGRFSSAGGTPVNNIARWRDCHQCLADITHDERVNVDDLLMVLGAWGPCPPQPPMCPADNDPFGGNNVVDGGDVLDVIQHWGPCFAPPTPCPHDLNYNGRVNVDDLLAVIHAVGPCPVLPPPCPADITHSGAVNGEDLLMVINAWGPCP